MNDIPKFTGWSSVQISDLITAYRKAKADCFYDAIYPTSQKFAEYEQHLLKNLKELLSILRLGEDFSSHEKIIGGYQVIPKKFSIKMKDDNQGHVYFSKQEQEFENIIKGNPALTSAFRIIGDFPVNAHILSALWINMVGHEFDACLDPKSCYGTRLKRISSDTQADKDIKPYHITSCGSFPPYFRFYQRWRDDALTTIRSELKNKRSVVMASLDLKDYYHSIDPTDILSDEFHDSLGLKDDNSLSSEEKLFTSQIVAFLKSWSDNVGQYAKTELGVHNPDIPGGLVIGLSASRVIANVMLHGWDRMIKQEICPVHYGRYVDDMLLVIRDPETIADIGTFMKYMQRRLGNKHLRRRGKIWEIRQPDYQKNSTIQLQPEKQRLFVLAEKTGLDLLDSIEKDMRELSSEHRLMPSPDQLDKSSAAQVLHATSDSGERTDTLRHVNRLSIRRLGWSLQLRHVETLSNDLPPKAWKSQRKDFYRLAHDHILQPNNLFSFFKYTARLLGFAIGTSDWKEAARIVKSIFDSVRKIEKQMKENGTIQINGAETVSNDGIWKHLQKTLAAICTEAAIRYYPPQNLSDPTQAVRIKKITKQLDRLSDDSICIPTESEYFRHMAILLARTDLARQPYKDMLSEKLAAEQIAISNDTLDKELLEELTRTKILHIDALKEFLEESKSHRLQHLERLESIDENMLPYIFPTRPYTLEEITELAPSCVGLTSDRNTIPQSATQNWKRYVHALRGSFAKKTLTEELVNVSETHKGLSEITGLLPKKQMLTEEPSSSLRPPKVLRIGTHTKKKEVTVALTNIRTSEGTWRKAACGKPRLTLKRYKQIADLINQTLKLRPRPDYVVFPELSIPTKWINSIAKHLSRSGINLVAGTEYVHHGKDKIYSRTCLVLADDRLGYPATIRIWQPKSEPAINEDKELTVRFGKHWEIRPTNNQSNGEKPVYNHNGFHFGILACSELQNAKERTNFQGQIDALMVLSWNKDLDTFSMLVEATALDLHAYVILVNNRSYGDSRVRSPAKKVYFRDLARIRGGNNDFVVAVTLDIDSLRAFQSRAKRWPDKHAPYKPVPEGFMISPSRKKMPPQ